ncbi:hypothetical protein MASR2M78_18350 [Treponema sp.]
MTERDFRPSYPVPAKPTYLQGTKIELIRPLALARPPEHVLFDFDGTLSLIREGWMEIMVPQLRDILLPFARRNETKDSIEALVKDFVAELTGKQTIYQMMRLAEEIEARGGKAADPQEYKAQYHDLLMARIATRRQALAAGTESAESMTVPGSLKLLALLRAKGVAIYIASGTDEQYVLEEARLLGLEDFAPDAIYGAQADHRSFSKEMVIQGILKENKVEGSSLLAFGDGYVEIADSKAVGGTAIAVASDEAGRSGKPDAWKRERLIGAGADLVVADYAEASELIDYIWNQR